jgi:hypothetical protein
MAYLYFAEGNGANATGEACVFDHKNFTGMDPVGATTARISFKSRNGAATDDHILITHTAAHGFKLVAERFTALMTQLDNTQSKGMVVVADEDNGIYYDATMSSTVVVTTAA